jgi:hypothetical protein
MKVDGNSLTPFSLFQKLSCSCRSVAFSLCDTCHFHFPVIPLDIYLILPPIDLSTFVHLRYYWCFCLFASSSNIIIDPLEAECLLLLIYDRVTVPEMVKIQIRYYGKS